MSDLKEPTKRPRIEHDDECPVCHELIREKGSWPLRTKAGKMVHLNGRMVERHSECGGNFLWPERDTSDLSEEWKGLHELGKQSMMKDAVPYSEWLAEQEQEKKASFDVERIKLENEARDRAVAAMPEGEQKETAKKGHGSRYGSCGHKIGGCRCPASVNHVKLTLDIPCEKCNGQEKQASVPVELLEAYKRTETQPTPAQAAAGNYRKGRVNIHGLDIAIENPPGSFREGVDKNGKKWKQRLTHAYGYFTSYGHGKKALWSGGYDRVQDVATDAHALLVDDTQAVQGLRRTGDNCMSALGDFREFPAGHGTPSSGIKSGSDQQQSGIFAGELPLGYSGAAGGEHASHAQNRVLGCGEVDVPVGTPIQDKVGNAQCAIGFGVGPATRSRDAGKRSSNVQGEPEQDPVDPKRAAQIFGGLGGLIGSGRECDNPAPSSGMDDETCSDGSVAARNKEAQVPRGSSQYGGVGSNQGYVARCTLSAAQARMDTRTGLNTSTTKQAEAPRGHDGDPVDVFIGPNHDSPVAFVVDQEDADGKFDEVKVMLCFADEQAARDGYLANYSTGWKGLGDITALTLPQLKWWLANGDMHKPLSGQMVKAAEEYEMPSAGSFLKDRLKDLAVGTLIEGSHKEKPERQEGETPEEFARRVSDEIKAHEKLASVIDKYRERNALWRRTFEDAGIPFKTEHLVDGGNFHKPHHVRQAFAAAGHDLPPGMEDQISNRMMATALLPHIDHDDVARQKDLSTKLDGLISAPDDDAREKEGADAWISAHWLGMLHPHHAETMVEAQRLTQDLVGHPAISRRLQQLHDQTTQDGAPPLEKHANHDMMIGGGIGALLGALGGGTQAAVHNKRVDETGEGQRMSVLDQALGLGVAGAGAGALAGAVTRPAAQFIRDLHDGFDPSKEPDKFFPGGKAKRPLEIPHWHPGGGDVTPEKYLAHWYQHAQGGYDQVLSTARKAVHKAKQRGDFHMHSPDAAADYLFTGHDSPAGSIRELDPGPETAIYPLNFLNNVRGEFPKDDSAPFDYSMTGSNAKLNNQLNGFDGKRTVSDADARALLLGHETRHAMQGAEASQGNPVPEFNAVNAYPAHRPHELTQALGQLKAETAFLTDKTITTAGDFRRLMEEVGVTDKDPRKFKEMELKYSPEGARMLNYMRTLHQESPEKYDKAIQDMGKADLFRQVVMGDHAKSQSDAKLASLCEACPKCGTPNTGYYDVRNWCPVCDGQKQASDIYIDWAAGGMIKSREWEKYYSPEVREMLGLDKQAVIKQEGSGWTLYTHDGSRVLGHHPSEAAAKAQEAAIHAHKHAADKYPAHVGFDLDGTLAKRESPFNADTVGEPVKAMVAKLREHLDAGDECVIFTARAVDEGSTKVIHAWLKEHGLPKLKVTNVKTPGLKILYDDRAVSVKPDKGVMKRAAAGIPDREDYGDISKLKAGDLVDYFIKSHAAERAGQHFDVRLGDKDKGLYSWATKKGMPDDPGDPRALFRQPLHDYGDGDFEGSIESGYGKGTVSQHEKGKALVTEAGADGLSFATDRGRWRLVAPKDESGRWLVVKAGEPPAPAHQKGHMAQLSPDKLEQWLAEQGPDVTASPKIDGALGVLRFRHGVPEVFSHRTSKRTGGPIEHTERLFGQRPKLDVPAELRGREFLGEIHGVRGDRVIPPQELGGILNSGLAKALETQRGRGIKLRLALHGLAGEEDPTARRQLLEQVAKLLPEHLSVVPEVQGAEAVRELLQQISAKRHPLTEEGIVVRGRDLAQRKVKLRDEADVHMLGTYPGKGKYGDAAGGFTYALSPGGNEVGRVGTGISDELRQNLGDYTGRVAKITHQGQFPGGAYRAPSLHSFHEEYPMVKEASFSLLDELAVKMASKPAGWAKFCRPENSDVMFERPADGSGKTQGDKMIKIYSGQNDWEDAPTWIWAEGGQGDSAWRVWFSVKYPPDMVKRMQESGGSLDKDMVAKGEALPELWWKAVRARLKDEEYVSDYSFKEEALKVLKEPGALGGMVDDCGAERRSWTKTASFVGGIPDDPPLTGPEAIQHALSRLDLDKLEAEQHQVVKRKTKTKLGHAARVLGIIQGMRRNEVKPADLMITKVPVLPPLYRPFSVVGETFTPGDSNELYKDLITYRDIYGRAVKELGHEGALDAWNGMRQALRACYGFDESPNPKSQTRGVKGFLHHITGTSPKTGWVQAKLISKTQDSVARGVIVPNPDLGLDEMGLPEEMAWPAYGSHVQRRMVRAGMSPADALRHVRDHTVQARRALELEMPERPVVLSRSPAWHQFNVFSATPKLIDGHAIQISPLTATGANADYDGDQMNIHVPATHDGVQEAQTILKPSHMAFSIRDWGQIVPALKHEQVLGLFDAADEPAAATHRFTTKDEALAAIRAGTVKLSDNVEIGLDKAGASV